MPVLKRLCAGHAPAVLAFELANRVYFAACEQRREGPAESSEHLLLEDLHHARPRRGAPEEHRGRRGLRAGTETALKSVQAHHGISADGQYGLQTRRTILFFADEGFRIRCVRYGA